MKRPSTKAKLEALKRGVELPVDPHTLCYAADPGPDERAVLQLAQALSGDSPVVSWENQVKAAEFFNAHGLAATLEYYFKLQGEK